MDNKNKPTLLKEYTEYAFSIPNVYLHVELDSEQTYVYCQMKCEKKLDKEVPLVLNGRDLKLKGIYINCKPLNSSEYKLTAEYLIINQVPDSFTLDIITVVHPNQNTSLLGLYQSRNLICTQCEANGFSKITYFPDRPDVLSIFTTSIVGNSLQFPVLLSNGNRIYVKEIDYSTHMVIWHDPYPKPCYLFALVAGPLVSHQDKFITMSGREIELSLYTESRYVDQCKFALEALKRAMRWDEKTYGREYDLDILMLVAVSDFNMGAMENKGLNIFNISCILAHPNISTDSDYLRVESVIAHEYFHNWSGNRVTCKNWFQLSLKEGLTVFREQQYMLDTYPLSLTRIDDIYELINSQFSEDASPLAHPVMPKQYLEINNFYTSTVYNKGAEVIWMLYHLLGAEKFRKGMDIYFSINDGKAVSIEDFIHAMEKAHNSPLNQFRLWYDQVGTPQIDVKVEWDDKVSILLHQKPGTTESNLSCYPLMIPFQLCFIDDNNRLYKTISEDGKAYDYHQLTLTKAHTSIEIKGVKPNSLLSLHNHFTAPVLVNYNYSNEELIRIVFSNIDVYSRWRAAESLHFNMFDVVNEQLLYNKKIELDPNYLSLFSKLLTQDDLHESLVANMIYLPSLVNIVNRKKVIDFDLIVKAHDQIIQNILDINYSLLEKHYFLMKAKDIGSYPTEKVYAHRLLVGTLLKLLAKSKKQSAFELIKKHLEESQALTDKMNALAALTMFSLDRTKSILTNIYQKWRHEDLLVNKWLSMVSSVQSEDVIDYIQEISLQKDFEFKNPNQVRALFGTFAGANLRYFHHSSGQGYQLMIELLSKLDKQNPQLAARMVQCFAKCNDFTEPRRSQMINNLKELKKQPSLSKDLFEVVHKLTG